MHVTTQDSTKVFTDQLLAYKKLIDADIELFSDKAESSALRNYGEHAALVSNAYTDILKRGGKRIRGVLTMVGYEMCGGTDQKLILEVARAVEMTHAYMLVIDDIQDRGDKRRGGPSAHRALEVVSAKQGWEGDALHTGVSLALNAALLGAHGAQIILANMDADQELRLKALSILNHTMMVTAHGQTHDIINEISSNVSLDDVEKVLQWKTAHYTILNPIHMGMVMAGAGCEDTNAITEYALNVGKAFQITDDLLVMSTAGQTGKDAKDDVREGKQTLIAVYALQNADHTSVEYLKKCLGNEDLTDQDFRLCQDIFARSGAIEYAQKKAEHYIDAARTSLNQHADRWKPESVEFLEQLAVYLQKRSN